MQPAARHSFSVLEQTADTPEDQAGSAQAAGRASSNRGSSSSSDAEERDLDNDFQDFVPSSAAVSSRRRSSGHLNFVDLVSAGIGSYLAGLESKQKDNATVYSRSTGTESSRWRACLEKLSDKYAKTPASKGPTLQELQGEVDRVVLKRPCDGRPSQQELGPCVPPSGLEFEHFPGADGKPRLSFCSSFESGNLAVAQCEGPDLYTLLVDVDANTDGYTQWFYFAVRGGIPGFKVTFRLVNMAKSGSLFGQGMKPAVWSEKSGRGWERGCADVAYSKSMDIPAKQPLMSGQKQWFTLSFSYTFEYHYPYTYTHLCNFLDALQAHPYSGSLFSRRVLCHTIGGLQCEVLDVDCEAADSPSDRGIAVMTARVHPGESNASWMMHGFISFILSPAAEAKALRQAFKWLIVPMLNPDGVVRGCYRCGLAGTDLNRVYAKPSKILHPEVYHLKETMKRAGRNVELFIDFHGHSKKEGIFFYGGKAEDRDRNSDIQLLPRLCCLASSDFKWRKCAFNLNESKVSTARLVGFRELGIQRVYTVEASFAGSGEAVMELETDTLSDTSEASDAADQEAQEEVVETPAQDEQQEQIKEAAAVLLQQLARERRDPPTVGNANRRGTRSDYGPGQQSLRRRSLRQMISRSGSEEDLRQTRPSSNVASPKLTSPGPSQLSPQLSPRSPSPRMSAGSSERAAQNERQEETLAKSKEKVKQQKRRGSELDGEMDCIPNIEFNPKRLELAGPTIGRAICAVWQLELPNADRQPADGLLDGAEARHWPHLRYHRMTAKAAQRELGKLISGRARPEKDGDDDGSDSNPSADEKPMLELRKLQRRLARKSKRQKTFKFVPECEPEEDIKYRVVVAFGKAVKVPIKGGGNTWKGSKVGEAVDKLMKQTRERRASMNDISGHDVEPPSTGGGDTDRVRSESPERSAEDFNDSTLTSRNSSKQRRFLRPCSPGTSSLRAMGRHGTRTSETSIVPAASSNEQSEEEPFETEPLECRSPISRKRTPQLHVIDLQVCGPRPGDASPLADSMLDEGSPLGDASPVSPMGDESGFDAPSDGPCLSPAKNIRTRPASAVQEATRPIVYSPGVPPVAGSNAGGSTIQIELPASLAVEVMDRRAPLSAQVRPTKPAAAIRTEEVHEVKLSHVTLPDIPTRLAEADRPPAVQTFKDWVEREDGKDEAVPGQSPLKSTAARPRTPMGPKVSRMVSGPTCSARTEPEPQLDHSLDKGVAESETGHEEIEKKPKVLSKVSVHFKTSQQMALSSRTTAARVTPHARRVGRTAFPRGQVQTLQLRPDGEPTTSDGPLSQRAIFKDDASASSPAARPHSAERFKVARPSWTTSSERNSGEAKVALLELCGSSLRTSGPSEDVASAWEPKQLWNVRGERQRAVSPAPEASSARSCAGRLRKGGWLQLNTE